MPPALDHIVILVPYATLSNPSLLSMSSAFTIIPGGEHADNSTANVLMVLKNGIYLELIAFIDDLPSKREGHWWGKKTTGTIMDWALTSSDVQDVQEVHERLINKKVQYVDPVAGGRKRPDGAAVKWKVTFPEAQVVRGTIPFWCHDVTPRDLRVSTSMKIDGKSITDHPSGTISIKSLNIVAPENEVDNLVTAYQAIFDVKPLKNGATYTFLLSSPIAGFGEPVISIRPAKSDQEEEVLKQNGGAGVFSLVLLVDGTAKPTEPLEEKIEEGTIRLSFET